jgi:hypothetical protein
MAVARMCPITMGPSGERNPIGVLGNATLLIWVGVGGLADWVTGT